MAKSIDVEMEAFLPTLRIEDAAEGIVRRDAVGQAQERLKPIGMGFAVQFDVGPGLLAADGGTD